MLLKMNYQLKDERHFKNRTNKVDFFARKFKIVGT